jgi:hypothetical protein
MAVVLTDVRLPGRSDQAVAGDIATNCAAAMRAAHAGAGGLGVTISP